MALITRVSRLFRADLHAVLDRIEEPDALLRQSVREMEEELASEEQRIKLLSHEQKQLLTRETELEHSLNNIEEELEICFTAEKDDLARALIKRKLEALRFQKILSHKRAALQESLAVSEKQLEENRSRLESMRQKVELLTEEYSTVQSDANYATADISVGDDDVEVAFLREKQKRSKS